LSKIVKTTAAKVGEEQGSRDGEARKDSGALELSNRAGTT